MDLGLTGRAALITAASEGLGLATAKQLAAAGCRVAICGRNLGKLDAARRAIESSGHGIAVTIRADLAQPAGIEPLYRSARDGLGGLNIVVINSGHMAYGSLEELDDSAWYEAFEMMLMSAMRLARLAIPDMRLQGGGDIVFITASGMKEPSPRLVLSNVMRAGIASFAKSLARTAGPDNIRVNVVAPGYFDTGRVRARVEDLVARDGLSRQDAVGSVAGAVPLGRLGQAEELADLVSFVVSRRAAFLTGSTVVVDGGASTSIF